MAKTKAPAKKRTAKKISSMIREKRGEIWRLADADGWLTFLRSHDPKGKWTRKGNTITGLCRLHNDKNPSLQVRPDKGMATCWSCQPAKYHTSDPIELLQTFIKKPALDVLNLLQTHFGKVLVKPEVTEKLAEYTAHRQMKATVKRLFEAIKSDTLDAYLRVGLAGMRDTEFGFAMDFWEYMQKRQVVDAAAQLPMFPLPPRPVITKYANAMNVPTAVLMAMEQYLSTVSKDTYVGHIVFMNDYAPNEIARMRLRKPKFDPNQKSIFVVEDNLEDAVGVFGLSSFMQIDSPTSTPDKPTPPERCAYVVEGEFCVAQVYQATHKLPGQKPVIVAHCGSSSHDLSALERAGYERIYYVPDADEAGASHAEAILAQNTNLDVRVFNWPVHLKSGGPEESADLDSVILRHGWEEVETVLIKERDKHFLKAELWAAEKFNSELRGYDPKDNAKAVKGLAARLSRCLGDPADPTQNIAMRNWVTERLVQAGIKDKLAADLSAELVSEDNEERLLCRRIEERLKERFCFICVETNSQHRTMRSWDRKRRVMDTLRTNNEGDIKAFFSNSVGPLLDWIAKELGGEPDVIKYGGPVRDPDDLPQEKTLLQREDHALALVKRFVLPKIVATLPTAGELEIMKAGNHYLETSTGHKWFVVNGESVYVGSYDISNNLHWEELPEPRYEKYMFDISQKEVFSASIKSLDDLTNHTKVPLAAALASVKDVLNTGWTFKEQESETTMLAGCILYFPISAAFDTKLQLYASAERSSGKTTLVSRCIGGSKNAFYNILEHSHSFDSFTSAGLRQRMDKNPRTLVLDEFDETDGDANNKNSEIYKFMRIAFSGGLHAQGSQSGQAVERALSINIIFAGIDPKIGPANQSRTIRIDLVNDERRSSPEISLAEAYPKDHFEKLRRDLALNCYSWMPEIKKHYGEVRHYYSTQAREEVPAFVNQRALDQLWVPVAVAKAAGWDWKAFFQTMVHSKRAHFETIREATETSSLWSAILYTPAIKLSGLEFAGKDLSVQTLLKMPEEAHKLNQSECGIYFHRGDGAKEYIVAVWPQVSMGLLRNHDRYRGLSPYHLKDKAGRHPNVLGENESRVVAAQAGLISSWMSNAPLSVFCLTDAEAGVDTKKQERKGATSNEKEQPQYYREAEGPGGKPVSQCTPEELAAEGLYTPGVEA